MGMRDSVFVQQNGKERVESNSYAIMAILQIYRGEWAQ